tara:strand:+ start:1211 stop:1477 length:267 start_codon:yes stop_codon:yes gene_type:complete
MSETEISENTFGTNHHQEGDPFVPQYKGHKEPSKARIDSQNYYNRHKENINKKRLLSRLQSGYNVSWKTCVKHNIQAEDLYNLVKIMT